jgi:hypothetical protein
MALGMMTWVGVAAMAIGLASWLGPMLTEPTTFAHLIERLAS